jgi:hypothetical protein
MANGRGCELAANHVHALCSGVPVCSLLASVTLVSHWADPISYTGYKRSWPMRWPAMVDRASVAPVVCALSCLMAYALSWPIFAICTLWIGAGHSQYVVRSQRMDSLNPLVT